MIGKEKLSFDPTDADTLAASDSVGAFVRSSDGTLITHTTVGSDEGLDVNIINSGGLTVQATDLDIRDLAFATDKVDVSGSEVSLDATTLAALENITVSATDLDIRDLAFATDSVDVSGSEVSLDATTLAALETITVLQGTDPWIIGDGGGSITVDAVDLDIRDLSAASDSVQANLFDGSGNAISSSSGALDINISSSDIEIDVQDDKANTAINSSQTDVDTTSAALLASQLAARRFLYVQNLSNKNIFIGESGVTAGNGLRMSSGSIAEFRLGPALSLHAVGVDAGGQDVRLMELS